MTESNAVFMGLGTLSSALFLLCLGGLTDQIKRISAQWRIGGPATDALSLNQFISSYLSFYGFFVYSFLLPGVNLFLFGTRLAASLLSAVVVIQIAMDRRSVPSYLATGVIALSMAAALGIGLNRGEWGESARGSVQIFIVATTLLLLQGGIHQVRTIWKKRSTGVLSKQMQIVFFLKDIANVLFGIAMGINDGWPLILMGSVSGSLKFAVLLQFRWLRNVAVKQ